MNKFIEGVAIGIGVAAAAIGFMKGTAKVIRVVKNARSK